MQPGGESGKFSSTFELASSAAKVGGEPREIPFGSYAMLVDRYSQGWVAPRKIHGQDIWNVQYAYVLDQYLDSQITLSAGMTNMFNTMPQPTPELGVGAGFESRLQDPFGRRYWVSIDWSPNN